MSIMKESFKKKVYSIVGQIQRGRVATYGQIARLSGNRKGARAVGFYMKINRNTAAVPCHRVVKADGSLAGYSLGGLGRKRKLLVAEGVSFIKDRVNLSVSRWLF